VLAVHGVNNEDSPEAQLIRTLIRSRIVQTLGHKKAKGERAVLEHLKFTRNAARDRVMFLLSVKAGLRAKEIVALTWGMVTDATGGRRGHRVTGQRQ
jgi:integrase